MMNLNWGYHPKHGFRFSLIDALAIIVCAVITVGGFGIVGSAAWLFPFVLGHFFLFCNVFRVPRKPELVWAAAFLVLSAACLISDVSILHAMWLVLPVTAGVLLYSICLPTYHGIFSRTDNGEAAEEDTGKMPTSSSQRKST